MVGLGVLLLADQRHVDDLVFVVRLADRTSVEDFHALGVGHRRRQSARHVVGDVVAADRNRIGVDQVAAVEHRDRGGAAAHVDQRHAEIHLVLHQAGEAGGEGGDAAISDLEMGALDADAEIAHGAGGRRDEMHIDAQPLAVHAARVAHAAAAVDRVADRHGVDQFAVRGLGRQMNLAQNAADIAIGHFVAADGDLDAESVRGRVAAADADHDLLDPFAAHLLGGVDGGRQRVLGRLHVDDVAALDAARLLVADADHAQLVVSLDAGDEAADLAAAEVERRDDAVPSLDHYSLHWSMSGCRASPCPAPESFRRRPGVRPSD